MTEELGEPCGLAILADAMRMVYAFEKLGPAYVDAVLYFCWEQRKTPAAEYATDDPLHPCQDVERAVPKFIKKFDRNKLFYLVNAVGKYGLGKL